MLALFSASFHDSVFAVGALVLFLALAPAVYRKSVLPISTCVITGGVLFIFTLNYITMNYWYAVVVETLNVLAWIVLYARAWQHKHSARFLKNIEKRATGGTTIRSAEGSAVGLSRSGAADAKRLAAESARRTSRLG